MSGDEASISPVFVDDTGGRRRMVKVVVALVAGATATIGGLLVAALLGAPVGPFVSLIGPDPDSSSGPEPPAVSITRSTSEPSEATKGVSSVVAVDGVRGAAGQSRGTLTPAGDVATDQPSPPALTSAPPAATTSAGPPTSRPANSSANNSASSNAPEQAANPNPPVTTDRRP